MKLSGISMAVVAGTIAIGSGAASAAPLPPPPDMERVAERNEERDSFRLPVAPVPSAATPEGGMRAAEGRLEVSVWRGEAGGAGSPVAVISRYREALEEAGWEIVYDCADTACGGVRRRFALEVLPAPAMLLDTADLALLTATFAEDVAADPSSEPPEWDGLVRLGLVATRVLGQFYLQAAVISPASTNFAPFPGPATASDAAEEPEAASPEAGFPEPTGRDPAELAAWDDPASLAEVLLAQGHLALNGIDFDIGTATLAPSSAAAIARTAEIIAALEDRPLAIVGHSDNSGALEPNVTLSRQRAEAVRQALIADGVAADRIEAHGVGWLAPLSSNDSDEGRAENRRVELVLR
ncbi:MAG: OmpA family protein [Pseudomonadota bacterium]